MNNIELLLSISTNPLANHFEEDATINSLSKLLVKNGFLVFDSALWVFSKKNTSFNVEVLNFNQKNIWKSDYPSCVQDKILNVLFFSANTYGELYGLKDECVYKFTPDNGDLSLYASSIEEWATNILSNWENETGYHLIKQWQDLNGPLEGGKRLMTIYPTILGGEYILENLAPVSIQEGLAFKGDILKQLEIYQDGSRISIKVT